MTPKLRKLACFDIYTVSQVLEELMWCDLLSLDTGPELAET